MDERAASDLALPPGGSLAVCPYCQSVVALDEVVVACVQCATTYHSECWQEASGCAVPGCSGGREAETASAPAAGPSLAGSANGVRSAPIPDRAIVPSPATPSISSGASWSVGPPPAAVRRKRRGSVRQGATVVAVLVGIVLTFFGGRALGYGSGERAGRVAGFEDGHSAGYSEGVDDGYEDGYSQGETAGYSSGHSDGYDDGYFDGRNAGFNAGCRMVFDRLGTTRVVDYWDWWWESSQATYLTRC